MKEVTQTESICIRKKSKMTLLWVIRAHWMPIHPPWKLTLKETRAGSLIDTYSTEKKVGLRKERRRIIRRRTIRRRCSQSLLRVQTNNHFSLRSQSTAIKMKSMRLTLIIKMERIKTVKTRERKVSRVLITTRCSKTLRLATTN